jgi:DMSO reductase family type II enzyme heme b subunit
MIIRARLVEGELPTGPEDAAWGKVSPMTLPLSGQIITRPVWPEPTARALTVRSLHNGTEIAFLLEWQDNTKNDRLTPGTFRDGVAIGLPLGDAPAFFCMGQLDLALEGRLAERYRSPGRQDFRESSRRCADV